MARPALLRSKGSFCGNSKASQEGEVRKKTPAIFIGWVERLETIAIVLMATQHRYTSESVPSSENCQKGWGDDADSPVTSPKTNTETIAFMSTNIAESIRSSLKSVASQRGTVDSSANILETTLIRNGTFCGRRFSLGGFSVVWFQEEGQIKLYSPSGTLEKSCTVAQFCSISGASASVELRRAA